MSFSSIKISDKTKEDLDTFRLDKESYNIAIQRLLLENSSLKREKQSFMDTTNILSEVVNQQSEEIKAIRQDKDSLIKIIMQTEDSIAIPNINHAVFFALVQVLKDKVSSDDEKVNALKVYLRPCLDEDVHAVLSMIDEFKRDNPSFSPILEDITAWINKSYCLNSN